VQKQKTIAVRRQRRRWHVRNKLRANSTRPRLSVYRSNKNLSVQLIDDATGRTLASASTRDKSLRDEIGYGGNRAAATIVGRVIAERALAAGVTQVQLDRGHYQYHGRVAALADAAREAGLQL
jgi:large subunit ribosomal protein L18